MAIEFTLHQIEQVQFYQEELQKAVSLFLVMFFTQCEHKMVRINVFRPLNSCQQNDSKPWQDKVLTCII